MAAITMEDSVTVQGPVSSTGRGAALSILLHVGIVALAYTGLPFFQRELPKETPPLIVDLVPIEEVTAAPPPAAEPTPDPVPLTPPEPPKPVQAEAPPADAMPPPPKKEEVVKKEEKKPEVKPPPKPAPPQRTKKDDVALLQSLLKDMQQKAPKPTPAQPSQQQSNNIAPNISDRASMTELDAIRRHIEDCWRIDPGKEGLENMAADIKVFINPDGSVQQAQIVDTARYLTDSAFRTFVTSARNAVLGCGNIPISPQRYSLFKEITMTFSPQGRIN